MWTKTFWKQAAERAAKSAAQAALGLWVGAEAFNAWDADWTRAGGVAVGGGVLSLLFSLTSVGVGHPDSPSAVKVEG